MRTLTLTRRFDQPVDRVYATITDPTLAPRWLAGIRRMTPVDEGGVRVGLRFRLDLDTPDERVQHTTVARHDPPTIWAVRTVESGFDATFRYDLAPDASGTLVTFTVDVRPTRLTTCLLFPSAIRASRRRLSDRLERLAAVLDGVG